MSIPYAPYIDGVLPAFCGDILKVPFEHNLAVGDTGFGFIRARVMDLNNNILFETETSRTLQNNPNGASIDTENHIVKFNIKYHVITMETAGTSDTKNKLYAPIANKSTNDKINTIDNELYLWYFRYGYKSENAAWIKNSGEKSADYPVNTYKYIYKNGENEVIGGIKLNNSKTILTTYSKEGYVSTHKMTYMTSTNLLSVGSYYKIQIAY
jgi:hypothetical protein